MKKINLKFSVLTISALILLSGYAGASVLELMGVDFGAPVYSGTPSTTDNPAGSIVYDSSSDSFKGLNAAGSWVELSPSAAIAARCTNSTSESIPDGVKTLVKFDSCSENTDGVYSTSTGKFTVPTGGDGWYLLTASIRLQSDAAWGANEFMQLHIFKNDAEDTVIDGEIFSGATNTAAHTSGSILLKLSAADTISIRLDQRSEVTQDTEIDSKFNHMSIVRVAN